MRKWLRKWLGIEILDEKIIDSMAWVFQSKEFVKETKNSLAKIESLKHELENLTKGNKTCVEVSEFEAYKKEVKVILERQDKELLDMGLAYQALDSRVELLEKQIKQCETKKHVDEYVN